MALSDEPELSLEELMLLEQLRTTIDAAVVEAYEGEYDGLTQEPPLTADIAATIRTELKHHPLSVGRFRIEVQTRNVPDRGRGSLEKRIGSDLYVSLVKYVDGVAISKGLLIQAKWVDEVRTAGPQVADMLKLTKESYLLVYGKERSPIVISPKIIDFDKPAVVGSEAFTLGRLISEGLKCTKGDRLIGRNLLEPPKKAMDAMLRDLAARQALGVELTDQPTSHKSYAVD